MTDILQFYHSTDRLTQDKVQAFYEACGKVQNRYHSGDFLVIGSLPHCAQPTSVSGRRASRWAGTLQVFAITMKV